MTAHTTKKRASETAAGGRSLGHWCSMSSASSPAASLASIRRHSGQSGPSHRVRCQRSVLVIRTVIGPRSRLAERSRWRPSLRRVGRALAAIAATCRACAGGHRRDVSGVRWREHCAHHCGPISAHVSQLHAAGSHRTSRSALAVWGPVMPAAGGRRSRPNRRVTALRTRPSSRLGVLLPPVVSRIVQALQHRRSSDSEQPRVAPLNPSSDPSSSGQPHLETIVTSISVPSPPLNLYHIEAVRDNKPVRFVVDLVTK